MNFVISLKNFFSKYSVMIYRIITKELTEYIRVEDLCLKANDMVPYLLPSFKEIDEENKLLLKDKEGLD